MRGKLIDKLCVQEEKCSENLSNLIPFISVILNSKTLAFLDSRSSNLFCR